MTAHEEHWWPKFPKIPEIPEIPEIPDIDFETDESSDRQAVALERIATALEKIASYYPVTGGKNADKS